MKNPLDWGYLTAPIIKTPTWGPFSIAFLAVFAVGMVATIVLYNDLFRRMRRNRLLYDAIRRYSAILMPIFAFGLIFFAFRALRVSAFYLYMRLWLYLAFAAAVAVAAYFVYYITTEYPSQVAAKKAAEVKRRYMVPSPSASAVSRSQRRSRRRKKARAGYKSAHR